jgi:methyl-accepting chemotaxis protein-1 (serine sensor receptor)
VAAVSDQIASGNSDLFSRTEQQAASLQQTASSMQQMTASVRSNAVSARQATQLAAGASEAAQRGSEVVGRVVSTMGEIQSSSLRIADIIGTIDGIACQANVMVLNAAVEAARAGESGRAGRRRGAVLTQRGRFAQGTGRRHGGSPAARGTHRVTALSPTA